MSKLVGAVLVVLTVLCFPWTAPPGAQSSSTAGPGTSAPVASRQLKFTLVGAGDAKSLFCPPGAMLHIENGGPGTIGVGVAPSGPLTTWLEPGMRVIVTPPPGAPVVVQLDPFTFGPNYADVTATLM